MSSSMNNILVVTGSARPNSVNQKVVPQVVAIVEGAGAAATIADLDALNMPFLNSHVPPSSPEFVIADEGVRQWTSLVAAADGVVLVTPEYNHTMSPIQLNAIDWIFKEWRDKPVALIGYGWRSGATQAHATAREALTSVLGAHVGDKQANLYLGRDLSPDGSVIDATSVDGKITEAVSEIIAFIDTAKNQNPKV